MESGAKVFMRKFKRIHFWILCPLAILLGFGSWYLSVRSLQQDTEKNRSKISSLYSTVNSVSNKEKHANDKVSAGMDALIDRRRQEVAAAWTERWNQQTDILTWPKELSEKFRKKVEGLRPIERFVDFPVPPEKELVRTLRMEYQEYIKKELVKLANQIGSAWHPDSRSGGNADRGRRGRRSRVDHLLVAWEPANQAEIEENHFDWSTTGGGSGMYDRGRRPSGGEGIPTLLEILYAQEDLWVLRSIMGVIERANAGATTRFSAAVKEIETIEMGRNAAQSRGQLSLESEGTPGADPSMAASGMPMEYERPPEVSMDQGYDPLGMPEASAQHDPANMRYVDNNYEPLTGERLRSVMKAEEMDPADATLAVAKRMPVRMRLRVDQRKLNRLLAECASAELTIEVRQLRINPDSSEERQGQRAAPSTRWEQPGSSSPATRNRAHDLFQYDVDVELYGIVYIYNPVDKQILGLTDEQPIDGQPVAEPADGQAPAESVPPGQETVMRERELTELPSV